jgi:hypothetical protein
MNKSILANMNKSQLSNLTQYVWRRACASFIALAFCGTPIGTFAQGQNPGGTVRGWGDNQYGQCSPPAGVSNLVSIAAGYDHSLGLKNDGQVAAWGENLFGQCTVPAKLSNVVAIAAGECHSLALQRDGSVVAWGAGQTKGTLPDWGQSAVPPGLNRVVAVAAGGFHSLALRDDGTVVAWGAGEPGDSGPADCGQSTVPEGLSNAVAIAAGVYHSLALRQDGTVIGWGNDVYGQSSCPPAGLRNVIAIGAGAAHSIALRADGTVVCWGHAGDGESTPPQSLNNVVAITASYDHNLALKNDGTVVAWGWNPNGECSVPARLRGVEAVAAGGAYSLALMYAGKFAPTIVAPPLSQTAEAGSTLQLGVRASGASLLSYQWFFNGNAIAGYTNPVLCLPSVCATNAGAYSVVVSNIFGVVTGAAMLNVVSAVERRLVPGVNLAGEAASPLNMNCADSPGPAPSWTTLGPVSLSSTSQYWFDLTLPLPPQRFYRTSQAGSPLVPPVLDLRIVPAITLTGSIGGSVRVDAINQVGPTDAWFTLDTVALTNKSQLYFDTSSWRQPQRLYRQVPVPVTGPAIFNVKDLGATGIGDTSAGATNDQWAIQQALWMACTNAYGPGGGCVYLPAGTYIVCGTNIVNTNLSAGGEPCMLWFGPNPTNYTLGVSNISIFGDGIGKTIIKAKPYPTASPKNLLSTGSFAASRGTLHVYIHDLTFDGGEYLTNANYWYYSSNATPSGVFNLFADENSEDIQVERVQFKNSLFGAGGEGRQQYIGCWFENIGSYAWGGGWGAIRDTVFLNCGFAGYLTMGDIPGHPELGPGGMIMEGPGQAGTIELENCYVLGPDCTIMTTAVPAGLPLADPSYNWGAPTDIGWSSIRVNNCTFVMTNAPFYCTNFPSVWTNFYCDSKGHLQMHNCDFWNFRKNSWVLGTRLSGQDIDIRGCRFVSGNGITIGNAEYLRLEDNRFQGVFDLSAGGTLKLQLANNVFNETYGYHIATWSNTINNAVFRGNLIEGSCSIGDFGTNNWWDRNRFLGTPNTGKLSVIFGVDYHGIAHAVTSQIYTGNVFENATAKFMGSLMVSNIISGNVMETMYFYDSSPAGNLYMNNVVNHWVYGYGANLVANTNFQNLNTFIGNVNKDTGWSTSTPTNSP